MSSVRRFVHVFSTFGKGGPQVRAVQLMQHLGASCRHVVIALDGCTDALAMLPRGLDVEVAPAPPRRSFIANVRAARRWLGEQRPDLVLTYNWGAIESALAARSLRLPLVHHEDGFGPEEASQRLRRRSWLRRFVLRSTPVIVPSLMLQRIATAEWRLRTVHHLPNGVDLQRFRPSPPPRELVIGTVGGLRAEKDHTMLLCAFGLLELPARLRIVGDGALAEPLREEAQRRGINDRVDWVGAVDDTAPCYAGLSVFVLSSRTEQMPIALLEAMASGLPVAATDVGDVRHVLPAAAAGSIVPAGDPPALAAALRRLAADADLRAFLGAANRRQVEERYEATSCLDRFVRVYEAAQRASR